MKVFDVYDKFDCRCSASEVGNPWEYRWGVKDANEGLCLHTEVGSPRPPDEVVTDADGTLLGTLPSSGVVAELERALAAKGSSLEHEAVKHSNVLAIVIRHKLEQEAEARKTRNPFDLSAAQIGELSTDDIKLAILGAMEGYIAEDRREAFRLAFLTSPPIPLGTRRLDIPDGG